MSGASKLEKSQLGDADDENLALRVKEEEDVEGLDLPDYYNN